MDVQSILNALRGQKEMLERAIAQLEELNSFDGNRPKRRRGRKFMGAEERQSVSERMKRYWAQRRSRTT